MKRIGEDIAEKLDYAPGAFSVERHIPGSQRAAAVMSLIQLTRLNGHDPYA